MSILQSLQLLNLLCGRRDFADIIKVQTLIMESSLDCPGGSNLITWAFKNWELSPARSRREMRQKGKIRERNERKRIKFSKPSLHLPLSKSCIWKKNIFKYFPTWDYLIIVIQFPTPRWFEKIMHIDKQNRGPRLLGTHSIIRKWVLPQSTESHLIKFSAPITATKEDFFSTIF